MWKSTKIALMSQQMLPTTSKWEIGLYKQTYILQHLMNYDKELTELHVGAIQRNAYKHWQINKNVHMDLPTYN